MVNAPGVLPPPISDATVPLALVAEAVSLSVLSQFRLVQRDRLSQWDSQGVEVRLFGKGQPAAQPGVDLDRLGEQLRPPALRLHPTPAGLEGAGETGGAFQGPVAACRLPFGAVAPGHARLDEGIAIGYPPVAGGLHAYGLVCGDVQPQLDGCSGGDSLPGSQTQQAAYPAAYGPDLVVVGALPPADAVGTVWAIPDRVDRSFRRHLSQPRRGSDPSRDGSDTSSQST